MKKGMMLLLVFLVCAFLLNGCATMNKRSDQSPEELKNQVITLQEQLQKKDAEIESLRKELSGSTQEKYSSVGSVQTEKPTVRQIQLALTNAGFDPGPVDGKMGRKTRSAIKDFQGANGLFADGKVGKKTWAALSEYLEKPVK
jgi:peptidoglycan hydrolase-like protein with peptidoglycan-binding domain